MSSATFDSMRAWFLETAFFHTKVYLLAFASILVPSMNTTSVEEMRPFLRRNQVDSVMIAKISMIYDSIFRLNPQ